MCLLKGGATSQLRKNLSRAVQKLTKSSDQFTENLPMLVKTDYYTKCSSRVIELSRTPRVKNDPIKSVRIKT